MPDIVALMRTFVRVVEAGSFTTVAVERNTSQPTISRQIATLEEQLGCLLFQRTTRSLALTDDGRVFYGHSRRTLEAADEAQASVGRRRGAPSGELRLSAAVVMSRRHIVPRLPKFLERYSAVTVDLAMSDAFSDLVEEGVDLAVRVGELTEPGLIARRIGTTRRAVVATPGYLARRGVPRSPAELKGHDCVVYSKLAAGAVWTFLGEVGPVAVPVAGRCSINNTEGVRAAILAGLGLGYVPVWHFDQDDFATGRLVALDGFEAPGQPIHAVYPSRRFLPSKVRAMIDYLVEEFAADPMLRT